MPTSGQQASKASVPTVHHGHGRDSDYMSYIILLLRTCVKYIGSQFGFGAIVIDLASASDGGGGGGRIRPPAAF